MIKHRQQILKNAQVRIHLGQGKILTFNQGSNYRLRVRLSRPYPFGSHPIQLQAPGVVGRSTCYAYDGFSQAKIHIKPDGSRLQYH
ncbi:hypothetical protein FIU95_16105 [Microbulbifer sp. THAF38]|nr:hypothetical protein FIU95_16105 [Microbulbifer sp. THAF38]